MPVGQMGNYQEYLKRIAPPLREIESTPVRQHMFGNPFKIDKVKLIYDFCSFFLFHWGLTFRDFTCKLVY